MQNEKTSKEILRKWEAPTICHRKSLRATIRLEQEIQFARLALGAEEGKSLGDDPATIFSVEVD
jgi:hypothetical protein